MKNKKLLFRYLLLTLALFPLEVLGQARGNLIPQPIGTLPGGTASTFTSELRNIILIVLGVVGLTAVAFLIWGGFRYITSAGNDEVAEGAKKTIQNAVIGLVVVILSYVIVVVITRALLGQV